jgi:DnaJ family protein C protein 22
MAKSLKIAYLLWLTGGLLGWHHFYLGRDKRGFLWFSTLGGFLIGLVNDLIKLPQYVNEANRKSELSPDREQLKLKAPIFIKTKFVASIVVASLFSYLLKNVMPSWDHEWLVRLASPCLIAFMVHVVGTDGPMKCQLKWPLFGSYAAFLIELAKGKRGSFFVSSFQFIV